MIHFVALVLFVTQALGQAPQPDAACQAWLNTSFGQNFTQCETDFPGVPTRTPANNCTVTQNDYDNLCGDSCFDTLTQAYNFFLTNGTCLNLYESYWGSCQSDADCTNPSLGSRVCVQGNCYTSCTTSDDCNSCNSEICDTIGQVQACRSNLTTITGNSTFRGHVYQIMAACSQNTDDDACALLFSNVSSMDLSNVSCSAFQDWGCCFGQMLTSMEFCAFQRFTQSGIYNCTGANSTCSGLPVAQQFCSNVNNTSNGTSSSSGTSSGISSSLTGSSGSGSSGSGSSGSGSSGSGSSGSQTGSTGVGGTGGNSAGTIAISWSLLVGLLLITPALT
jgi:hypothetical protein